MENPGFQQYLLNKGYKAYRKINKNDKWELVPNYYSFFTTMESGGLDIRYIKNDIEFIFGISEYDVAVTVIWPNPTINSIDKLTQQNKNIRALSKYGNEEYYKACLNKEITLEI